MNEAYLKFLYNLGQFNIKLGLSTIRCMLNRMGSPHHHPRIIHIAGTNGKGSTLATLERLLLDSGFTTGATISPHLISFNERFRLNGHQVNNQQLEQAFEAVCHYCDIELNLSKAESNDGLIKPTFFEFAIAIAFEIFRANKVDYILLETGLGGRLDATNVVEEPLACVITRIGLDHQEFLGESLEQITREKLGILKKNCPVFVAEQCESVSFDIAGICRELGIAIKQSPLDFFFENSKDQKVTSYRWKTDNQGKNGGISGIQVKKQSLLGNHQKQNTATALAVYHSIVPESRRLSKNQLIKALQNVSWKGRLEYLDREKRVLIDGAHNKPAIENLMEYLKQAHSTQHILFGIGWKKDKQFVDAIDLNGLARVDFIPIILQTENALHVEDVSQRLSEKGFSTLDPMDAKQLVSGIKNASLPQHQLLVVAGSLYLLGEFLEEWHRT